MFQPTRSRLPVFGLALIALSFSGQVIAQESKTPAPDTAADPSSAEEPRGPSYNVPVPSSVSGAPQFEWNTAPEGIPPALTDAITIVTAKDPSALAAWAGTRGARADVKGALWLRYPSLTTDLSLTNATDKVAPSVVVEVPLWAGGQISSTIQRARRLESASLARWHETVVNLALQVNETYYAIVLYTRLERLYQESLKEHEDLVASMQRRVDQEVSPLVDLELVRSRKAQIEQELTSISAQRQTALQNLAELVRDPSYNLGPVPEFGAAMLAADWTGAVTQALEYSPSRAKLIFEADALRSEIAVTRGGILPRVSAQYSYNEITGSRVGIGLRFQAQNGLSQLSAVSSATAKYDQSLDQIRLAERQIRQEIANDIVTYEAATRRAQASRSAASTAQRVSASYMRQFIAGRRSWLDVMNSLRENLSASSGLAQAEVGAMSAATRLYLLSGRWRPTLSNSK